MVKNLTVIIEKPAASLFLTVESSAEATLNGKQHCPPPSLTFA